MPSQPLGALIGTGVYHDLTEQSVIFENQNASVKVLVDSFMYAGEEITLQRALNAPPRPDDVQYRVGILHAYGNPGPAGSMFGHRTIGYHELAESDSIDGYVGGTVTEEHDHGRWPANLIHDGSDEVLGTFPGASASSSREGEPSADRRYNEKGGTNFSLLPGVRGGDPAGRWPANLIHDGSDEVLAVFPDAKGQQGDLKAHNKDRESPNGCFGKMGPAADHLARVESDTSAARFFYCAKANKKERGVGNTWPTVKPLTLMRYLVRLVTPPGGTVLDPFLGSGTTGLAANLEGFNFIGIDNNPLALAIARTRLQAA